MSYIPLHDRPPHSATLPLSLEESLPRYGSPDLDLTVPLHTPGMSDTEQPAPEVSSDSSRKRRRQDDETTPHNGHGEASSSSRSGYTPRHRTEIPILPSIFGIAPRNEFTRIVGDFILNNARGLDNVEVGLHLHH